MITLFMSESEYQRLPTDARTLLLGCASNVIDGDELDNVAFDAARQYEMTEDHFERVARAMAGVES